MAAFGQLDSCSVPGPLGTVKKRSPCYIGACGRGISLVWASMPVGRFQLRVLERSMLRLNYLGTPELRPCVATRELRESKLA